jgi:hypothetical protein
MDEEYSMHDGDGKHTGFLTSVRSSRGKRLLAEFKSVWGVTVKRNLK